MTELRTRYKENERLTTLLEQTYLEKMRVVDPKLSLTRLRALLERETYMTADEAVQLGLADRVLAK